MWHVYLLYTPMFHRTYIGCTTDPKRRLRQHNQEIAGGAKSTRKHAGHWQLRKVLSGFKNRSEAMRWEKILKSRCWGLEARDAGFVMVDKGKCPGNKKAYLVPQGIKLYDY